MKIEKRGTKGALIGVLSVVVVALAALFVGSLPNSSPTPQKAAEHYYASLFRQADSERDYLSERSTHVALPPELSFNTATPVRTSSLGRGRTHLGHHLKYNHTWQPSTPIGCSLRSPISQRRDGSLSGLRAVDYYIFALRRIII